MRTDLLLGKDTHRELSELLRAERELVVSGLSNETAKALITAHLLSFLSYKNHCALLVARDTKACESLLHWLLFFGLSPEILSPVVDVNGHILHEEFQRFLFLLFSPHSIHKKNNHSERIFLVSRATFDAAFPDSDDLQKGSVLLRKGGEINFTELVEVLLARGYNHSEDVAIQPGEYRRTGEVLDIYPIQSPTPYRAIFDFDHIQKITTEAGERWGQSEETMEELVLLPMAYTHTRPLSSQIPVNALLILDDQDDIELQTHAASVRFTAFPESLTHHVHLRYLSILKFYTLTDFLNDVRDKLQQKWVLLVVTKRPEELQGILHEEHIPHTLEEKREPGVLTIIAAAEDDLLPHSLQNPDLKCALLTDREIFTLRKTQRERSIQKLALDFITSLQPGDYVVHMDHGIGHFEGMTQKVIDDVPREYLELTYAEGDKLFIPVDQADKLSKFVHEEGTPPILTRLGTVEWKRLMERVQKETREIAKELLTIYAKRAKAKGVSFGEDTTSQKKFEEAFSYQETPGQMKAIADLKTDMESHRPMDRLICGDVGFGKTEVAMRAAFKAVQAGKQVAFLAPITILADQHYRTFLERMKEFPLRIEMLSRFRTPKEQQEILERLRKGSVDIIIGTHRLLQDDVQFFNLGIVIIDEEQRFGVKQKEKFKQMRASVDVLTLTATPIPRTLNLGLHKLRDISTITTPPPGRLPIITEVRKYSDELTRQAIVFEIERGGQCFVLHNRVETIDAFADKLRTLVPEATFIVGHGQLSSDALEERILAFKDGKYNVLVSSTIIENGIDLPRANTLIVNEAERFGLAQLYQLRGRVGRSRVQAYAYFLYHTQKLKDDAKKRLRAIVEACELGSGFQVAMRDLEIRGAGEILGANQSGVMQTVGVSHYLRLLKNTVDELQRGIHKEAEEEVAVEIQLPIQAFIPSFYIPDEQEKINVYQKLAGSEEEAILGEFEADLREEYGMPPTEVKNLFAVLRLKIACRRARVHRVKAEEMGKGARDIILTLASSVTAKEIMQLVAVHSEWRISGLSLRASESALLVRAKNGDWLSVLEEDVELLKKTQKTQRTQKASRSS